MTIFLVKSKLSTAKKSKTTTFSRAFHLKKWQFSQEIKVVFLDKKWRFRTVWSSKWIFGQICFLGQCAHQILTNFFLAFASRRNGWWWIIYADQKASWSGTVQGKWGHHGWWIRSLINIFQEIMKPTKRSMRRTKLDLPNVSNLVCMTLNVPRLQKLITTSSFSSLRTTMVLGNVSTFLTQYATTWTIVVKSSTWDDFVPSEWWKSTKKSYPAAFSSTKCFSHYNNNDMSSRQIQFFWVRKKSLKQ